MDEDPDFLDKLAESVADGHSIDWADLARLPKDDPRRVLLEQLRVVAEIAEHHRSAVDDPAAETITLPEFDLGDPAVPVGTMAAAPTAAGRWGHLLLRRKIGEGAFGEVFHAHDTWLDHPVALKLLKPEVAARDSSQRILHEARRLARVRHPNVVTVHGADSHGGRLGFWMELVEGQTLAALAASGRLSAGEAAQIGQELCLALAAVHHAELVHRDVKAQNVMRARDGGRIILMDFGAGEPMGATGRGALGTPLYVAPELFHGAPAAISTDIYALGVLLYFLVTGQYPVMGASLPALIDAHAKGARRRLRDVRPDLPDGFATVVERAIEPDPARRFQSAGDFHAALGGTLPRPAQPGPTKVMGLVLRWGAIAAAGLAATEALGWFGSRTFEAVLNIDPAFGAGLATFFSVGANVVVPFAITWTLAGAAVMAVVAIVAFVSPYTGRLGARVSAWRAGFDPLLAAGLIVAIGAAGLVGLIWSFYDVYNALVALALDPNPDALDLSVLGPAGHELHRSHVQGSVALSFFLGLAVWRWFPGLERRAADPGRVRVLKWTAALIAALVVAGEAGTRPFLWDDLEIVAFENRSAFVIGSNGAELLLYSPVKGERKQLRVRLDAPGLQRNVAARALFEQGP